MIDRTYTTWCRSGRNAGLNDLTKAGGLDRDGIGAPVVREPILRPRQAVGSDSVGIRAPVI